MTERPTPRDAPDWLFSYGTLGPRFSRGREQSGWVADAVRGELYDLGPYPALVRWDDPDAGWVEGHARPTDADELSGVLDPYEGVDEGLFRRAATVTRAGRPVWVYVYARPLPQYARGPLARWSGPEPPARDDPPAGGP
jgi:gamma-glutamylcyclotransferase (GGCT)/AIG2-like uncharacterized protein YtfP